MASDRVEGLRRALELSPENHALRLLLVETLAEEGLDAEVVDELRALQAQSGLPRDVLLEAGRAAAASGEFALASDFASSAEAAGAIEGVADLRREINVALGLDGVMQVTRHDGPDGTAPPFEFESGTTVNFADVGGLDDVKKAIHRTIILPYQRPDLYAKYGRGAGGGVLLYGAPGCGKTMLARATASECGLPFSNVRIEEILDPFIGQSERNLHDVFVQARRAAPCVLFLDELDAIGFARRKHTGSAGRPLVDQLLQELDSIGSDNEGILVLAATNAPWDVDEALKRPGRFDRTLFVPPPDETARRRIFELALRDRPSKGVDVKRLAKQTPLFSGADLGAVVERAVDAVIDEVLDSGEDRPLEQKHFERALAGMRPTTLEWLGTARNYVDFANQGGRYDEVRSFLVSREAKGWHG